MKNFENRTRVYRGSIALPSQDPAEPRVSGIQTAREEKKGRTIKKEKALSSQGWLQVFRGKLRALEKLENDRLQLKRGVELLAALLEVSEELGILCYEIKIVLGLDTRPE